MKTTLILFVMFLAGFNVLGQYSTPGTGVTWDLEDLIGESNGAVTYNEDTYFIHENLEVLSPDTILLEDNAIVKFYEDILITVQGVWIANPPDSILFTATDTNLHYKSFRFEDSDASLLKNCILEYGGGLDLLNTDMHVSNCIFRNNDQSNSTGTIDLFFSNPYIGHNEFRNNEGPAVMSGANSQSSPLIRNNFLYRNNTLNANMPQINLGTSDPEIPIQILRNSIQGYYENSGGIAVTTLAGGSLDCIIDSNGIYNNRYGITVYGYNITSIISNNLIVHNNIENLPMQGGSGINFWGDNTNTSHVFRNNLYENLWGITVTGEALPNLGQLEPDSVSPGRNLFTNNGNGGVLYALYNNTPNDLYAQNNYWGTFNLDSVEAVIFHHTDDETLGFVNYIPITDSLLISVKKHKDVQPGFVFPNPAINYVCIEKPDPQGNYILKVRDCNGRIIINQSMESRLVKLELTGLSPGLYLIELVGGDQVWKSKFIKQ